MSTGAEKREQKEKAACLGNLLIYQIMDCSLRCLLFENFLIKLLFDQREKSYLFSSLFFLIFYLEKSRGEKWRKVKSEKRIEKRTKRKSRLRDFSFWSWKWDLNPRPIDYESIALPLRHSSIRLL